MSDTLTRDDLKNLSRFERLNATTQKLLKRAASYRKPRLIELTSAQVAEIDANWLMVPSKKRGERQVVVSGTRCWAL